MVPCINKLDGRKINYLVSMYLDDDPPTAAGREVWGFGKKRADPTLGVEQDVLCGVLKYAGEVVAQGTMGYKHRRLPLAEVEASLCGPACNLRIIPDVNPGLPARAQLVEYAMQGRVSEAWAGPAALSLFPHAQASVANLPVLEVQEGKHIIGDLTLPYGKVIYDYKKCTELELDSGQSEGLLTPRSVLACPSMPFASPSFGHSSSKLYDREYCVFSVESTADALLAAIPEDLELISTRLTVEFVRTSGSSTGLYNKVTVYAPVRYHGIEYKYSIMALIDNGAPATAGRERWGQPYKFGFPRTRVELDTLVATIKYGKQMVAVGTMPFKVIQRISSIYRWFVTPSSPTHPQMTPLSPSIAYRHLEVPELCLKLIPGPDGQTDIAQLVSLPYQEVDLITDHVYQGNGAMQVFAHSNFPLSKLASSSGSCPAMHFTVRKTQVGHTHVILDYLKVSEKQ